MKILGIDPDMRKPGACVLSDDKLIDIGSMSMSYLIASIPYYIENGYTFAIEDVNAIKGIYTRNKKGNQAMQAKIAQNVGMVKSAATILIDYIEHLGGNVVLAPAGVGKQVKNSPALFAQLSGYKGRTNEDCRDAWAIAKWAQHNITGKTT
jgi:hypothetical protein